MEHLSFKTGLIPSRRVCCKQLRGHPSHPAGAPDLRDSRWHPAKSPGPKGLGRLGRLGLPPEPGVGAGRLSAEPQATPWA